MNEPLIKPNEHSASPQFKHSVKDLVYNPETGDFEQVDRGTTHEGDTVTQMSIDRFALTILDWFTANNSSENGINPYPLINEDGVRKDLIFNPETNEFEVVDHVHFREEDIIY